MQINPTLATEARKVLDVNKSERHIRGGLATKDKYMKERYMHQHAQKSFLVVQNIECFSYSENVQIYNKNDFGYDKHNRIEIMDMKKRNLHGRGKGNRD